MNPLQQAAFDRDLWQDVRGVLRRLATCPTCRCGCHPDFRDPGCPDCGGTGHSEWVETRWPDHHEPAIRIPLDWLNEGGT